MHGDQRETKNSGNKNFDQHQREREDLKTVEGLKVLKGFSQKTNFYALVLLCVVCELILLYCLKSRCVLKAMSPVHTC